MSTRFRDENDLVRRSLADAQAFADTIRHYGPESREAITWATYGGRLGRIGGLDDTDAAVEELENYYSQVEPHNACWVDNTTLVSAMQVTSGADGFLTPITLWDLAQLCNAVVFYDRIYHHADGDVDDDTLNHALGDNVLRPVTIPSRMPASLKDPTPTPFNGVVFQLNEIWEDSHTRLQQLSTAVGIDVDVDGSELAAMTRSWEVVLGRTFDPQDLVNSQVLRLRFQSPSHHLPQQIVQADNSSSPLNRPGFCITF
jgi:hypothetical protein